MFGFSKICSDMSAISGRFVAKFLRNRRGNIALITALTMPVMVLSGGGRGRPDARIHVAAEAG